MRHFWLLGCVSVAMTLLVACHQTSSVDTASEATAIRNNEAQWNQDWVSKDLAKIAAHYADNAVLMIQGMPATEGRDAIQKSLAPMTADPAMSLKFQPTIVEVAASGDLAYTQGKYILTLTDPATKQVINDHGSYVTTYRKQPDGSWKAVADIATSEVPPPAPAAPAGKTQ